MKPQTFDAHASLEDGHWWFRGRQRIVDALLTSALRGRSEPSVLDVGCGTGGTLGHLRLPGRKVGVDVSVNAVAHARARFPSIEFEHYWGRERLAELTAAADAVLLLDVLEHVEEDRALLESVVLPARRGTQVLVTVPADPSLWSEHDVIYGHYRRYTMETLRALWDGLPARPRLFSAFNAYLYPPIHALRAVRRRLPQNGRPAGDLRPTPPLLNAALGAVFAREKNRLLAVVDHPERPAFRRGVSLVALYERT